MRIENKETKKHGVIMEKYEYPDGVHIWNEREAKKFVHDHRNIFARGVRKRSVYKSKDYILICETGRSPNGDFIRAYWAFGKDAYIFLREAEGIDDHIAIDLTIAELKDYQ